MGSLELELGLLAVHLAGRRADTLRAWRDAIRKDPTLTSGDSLPRAQLNDHIPCVLEAFERELSLGAGEHLDTEERNEGAAAHGLHRWQQGYDLREVIRELGALNVCVVCELDAYAKSHPELEHEVMATARRQWASSCSVDIESSTHQYFRLQQTEAAGHIEDLKKRCAICASWSASGGRSGTRPRMTSGAMWESYPTRLPACCQAQRGATRPSCSCACSSATSHPCAIYWMT